VRKFYPADVRRLETIAEWLEAKSSVLHFAVYKQQLREFSVIVRYVSQVIREQLKEKEGE